MPSRAGSPNKLKQALLKRLTDLYPDYHPVIEMAKIANDPEADPQMRFNANKEVAQYVTPKLKASEVNMTAEVTSRVGEMTDAELFAYVKQLGEEIGIPVGDGGIAETQH